jgi:hypothetical protein
MRKPKPERPPERPVHGYWWAAFIAFIVLVYDPLGSFFWNTMILAGIIFGVAVSRSPRQLEMLKDAADRLDRHRQELHDRVKP